MRPACAVTWPGPERARYRREGLWAGKPLTSWIEQCVRDDPDGLALIDDGVRLSRAELWRCVERSSRQLQAMQLGPGDAVIIQMANSWRLVVLLLACLRIGVGALPALPSHRREELSAFVAATGAVVIFTDRQDGGFDLGRQAYEFVQHGMVKEAVVVPEQAAGDGVLSRPTSDADLPSVDVAGDMVAVYLASGGTTGRPKVVPRTHDDYAYMARRSGQLAGCGSDTVYLAVLPMAHGYPMSGPGYLGVLMRGGCVVVAKSPAPERVFPLIERHHVTMTSVVPAVLHRWLEALAEARGQIGASLRLVQCAAAKLPPDDAARVDSVLGCELQQVYGMSEGLLCMTRRGDSRERTLFCQGAPISDFDELRVVDERGNECGPGQQGELLTRGPYTVRGYVGLDGEGSPFDDQGWYHTGDLVELLPDRYLRVQGRVKDIVNRGGEKVSAAEVERVARQALDCALLAIVPVPDADLGERVGLIVTEGCRCGDDLALARRMLREGGLAEYKLPEHLLMVDELPMANVGKVDKRALIARFDASALSAS